MPKDIIWIKFVGIAFVIFVFLRLLLAKKPRLAGQAAEKETLKTIKNFLKNNNYKKKDYLLVNNLIFQRENYWSCEIDILLLTRKRIYVIEVKGWGRGKLSGDLNHEYLEWSYKVGKQKRYRRHRMYSPFWQNETHIKRLKSYFGLQNNQNALSVICFNSPYLEINLKENKKTVFENKHVWVNNGYRRNLTNVLIRCENQNTQLNFFEQLKEKISQEVTTPDKVRRHRTWVKEAKELR